VFIWGRGFLGVVIMVVVEVEAVERGVVVVQNLPRAVRLVPIVNACIPATRNDS